MPPPLPDRSRSSQNSRVGGTGSQGRRRQTDDTSTSKRRQSDARPSEQVLKRPKQGEAAPAEARRMSKVLGKRPDPEPRSAFRPQEGVKRLVIKNLRTASRANDLEQYYTRTWNELDAAIAAIFAQQPPRQPLERLYRGVEDICRHGKSKELYDLLRQRCETYLNQDMSRSIKTHMGGTAVEALRSVHRHWVTWNQQSVWRLPNPIGYPPDARRPSASSSR